MTNNISNPRNYRLNDIKIGDKVVTSKYYHSGFCNNIPVEGICYIWGNVIDIPNQHHALVLCNEVRCNDVVIQMPEKYQYKTSINFWKGATKSEELLEEEIQAIHI